MTSPKKAIISFLLSTILITGIGMLFFSGFLNITENRFYNSAVSDSVIGEAPLNIILISIYITIFLIIFLCLNFKQDLSSVMQMPLNDTQNPFVSGEETIPDTDLPVFTEPPLPEEIEELAVVDTAPEAEKFAGGGPQESQGPQGPRGLQGGGLLAAAERIHGGVILEQNGIPYISSDTFQRGKNEKLDSDFEKLVDSVIGDY